MPGSRLDRIIPKIKNLGTRDMRSVIELLSRERGFLETVFRTIREAVIVVDEDLHIVYHNNAAKEMLGLPDELSRLTMNKLLPGVNWATLLPSSVKSASSSSAMRQELEISYPSRRIVQFYALPLEGEEPRFVIILNDITQTLDRANFNAESEKASLISMLAGSVAHEIGNPLNSLYLHLQFFQRLLKGDELDRAELESEVDEARREVERLDMIIREFLHALRHERIEFQVIDLRALLLESLSFMRHEISSREVKVEFIWDNNVPFISGDPDKLKQAFYNLVKNAVQSMSNGGHLQIHCSADDDFVTLAVRDSGCGIRRENIGSIFKPYFTTKGAGTGLGLMIVERIVRDHGASLAVDSEEGEGTTFTISFPRREKMVKVLPPPEKHNEIEE